MASPLSRGASPDGAIALLSPDRCLVEARGAARRADPEAKDGGIGGSSGGLRDPAWAEGPERILGVWSFSP